MAASVNKYDTKCCQEYDLTLRVAHLGDSASRPPYATVLPRAAFRPSFGLLSRLPKQVLVTGVVGVLTGRVHRDAWQTALDYWIAYLTYSISISLSLSLSICHKERTYFRNPRNP